MDNQIDKNSGSVQMRATFENPKGWLVPGNYMKVTLIAPKSVSYMTVPQSCAKGDAMSGYYVWAVEDGKTVRKDIKVSEDLNNNWIVESGLSKNDQIVVAGIQNITMEGQKVKIMDAETYNKKQKAGK